MNDNKFYEVKQAQYLKIGDNFYLSKFRNIELTTISKSDFHVYAKIKGGNEEFFITILKETPILIKIKI